MQLTDDEIREILRREKRRKRLRQQKRRRIIVLLILLLIIAVIAAIKLYPGKTPAASEAAAPRGVIFLDPGHGGDDPGSDNGARYEKDDVLKLSLAVKTYLESAGFEVQMSRTDDTYVEESKRAEMANQSKARLMISLHRNDADGKGEGVEAYIPKEDTKESRLLAESIVRALASKGFARREITAGTLKDPEADYEEIAGLNMPGVLVEVGFISSMEDNELFDKNLEENAKAISAAIETTFASLYEPQEAEQTTEEKPQG